jgi:hypothetical protein
LDTPDNAAEIVEDAGVPLLLPARLAHLGPQRQGAPHFVRNPLLNAKCGANQARSSGNSGRAAPHVAPTRPGAREVWRAGGAQRSELPPSKDLAADRLKASEGYLYYALATIRLAGDFAAGGSDPPVLANVRFFGGHLKASGYGRFGT